MPIDYQIDHDRRLVIARGKGVFSGEDVFAYQREVWSLPEVAGYNELIDMTEVERFLEPSAERMQRLAQLSSQTDPPTSPSQFAIVAPTDLAYGLGRMYESYRSLEPQSTKSVHVFRTLEEALAFLGLDAL